VPTLVGAILFCLLQTAVIAIILNSSGIHQGFGSSLLDTESSLANTYAALAIVGTIYPSFAQYLQKSAALATYIRARTELAAARGVPLGESHCSAFSVRDVVSSPRADLPHTCVSAVTVFYIHSS
jgi:hypothetical protein